MCDQNVQRENEKVYKKGYEESKNFDHFDTCGVNILPKSFFKKKIYNLLKTTPHGKK